MALKNTHKCMYKHTQKLEYIISVEIVNFSFIVHVGISSSKYQISSLE